MEEFQLKAKSENFPELNEWPWYVDDSVLKCLRNKSTPILNHLNSIDPEHIKFTMEEEENNKLPSLDLELNVNRKRKKVEFNVHYKKTNTNITIKKRSNHRESIKRGVIKGYADRARAYCDPPYLEKEMKNIVEVFEDNGFTRTEIEDAMKEKTRRTEEKEKEQTRGMVVMQNIPGFTEKFNRIARKHGFQVANNTDNRVKDLISNAKTPLGGKNTNVVYRIPCKCRVHSYTGETDRKWESRENEHKNKVRLTLQDIQNGDAEKARKRMNDGDGGLAKHASHCKEGVDWENARIVAKEAKWTQRKFLEGIETLKEKNKGIHPLNSYNKMEQWQSMIYSFIDLE